MAAKYPTPEEKHGMNIQLLRSKSEEYLRNAFHKTFPKNRTHLYVELKKHEPELQKLLKKGFLNQNQYDILFPQSKQTDSSKFDTTLLFLLLRHFCGYRVPTTGWNNEPDQNDQSEIANLIRLKIGRNQIQHLPPSITDAEYKDVYLYLRQPLLDLGCPLKDICHARSFKYDNQPAVESFLGREDELNEIRQVVNNGQPIHGFVIAGIPGVGKTELARKYCQQYGQEFEHIIWVNCDSIENSFRDIAQSLKLDCRQAQGFKDLKVIAKLIREYFKNEKVLFVFDNCINGSEDLIGVLSPQHHNIITTQIRSWGQDYKFIKLEVWPKAVAFDFLQKHMKQGNKDLFEHLIDEFNCHPLALQHAVAFIKEIGLPLKEYLKLLNGQKLDVLSERVAIQHGVTKSVFSSFQITISKIREENPKVFEFLSIFSILEINSVKEEFLERYFGTCFDFIKAIKVLQKFNVVKKCVKVSEFRKEKIPFYTMHSLYQCSIKTYNAKNGKKIINLIFKMINKVMDPDDGLVWSYQFQHIWYHQKPLRKSMMQGITSNIFLLDELYFYSSPNYCVEILEELYQELKEKTDDIVLYWVKFILARLFPNNETSHKINNILSEIEQNVSPSFEQERLIYCINGIVHKNVYKLSLYREGYFNMLSNERLISSDQWDSVGTIFKELKQYK